jgi:hypothetical protein
MLAAAPLAGLGLGDGETLGAGVEPAGFVAGATATAGTTDEPPGCELPPPPEQALSTIASDTTSHAFHRMTR